MRKSTLFTIINDTSLVLFAIFLFTIIMVNGCGAGDCETAEEGSLEHKLFCKQEKPEKKAKKPKKNTTTQSVSTETTSTTDDLVCLWVADDGSCEEYAEEEENCDEEEVVEATPTPTPLSPNDDFSESSLNTERWSLDYSGSSGSFSTLAGVLNWTETTAETEVPTITSNFEVTSTEYTMQLDLKINQPNHGSAVYAGVSHTESFGCGPNRAYIYFQLIKLDGMSHQVRGSYCTSTDGFGSTTSVNVINVDEDVSIKIEKTATQYVLTYDSGSGWAAFGTLNLADLNSRYSDNPVKVLMAFSNPSPVEVDTEVDNFTITGEVEYD